MSGPLVQSGLLTGADVLDPGCGIGSLAWRIVGETGAASATAIDVDAAQIAGVIEKGNVSLRIVSRLRIQMEKNLAFGAPCSIFRSPYGKADLL